MGMKANPGGGFWSVVTYVKVSLHPKFFDDPGLPGNRASSSSPRLGQTQSTSDASQLSVDGEAWLRGPREWAHWGQDAAFRHACVSPFRFPPPPPLCAAFAFFPPFWLVNQQHDKQPPHIYGQNGRSKPMG